MEAETATARRTTIEELLNDTAFESGDNSMKGDVTSEAYSACLNDFIKGDHKQCLEGMLNRGLLSPEVLSVNYEIWKLFVGACQEVDFHVLGTSVMKVLRINFAQTEFSATEQKLTGKPPTELIAGLLAYLKCSYKIAEQENSVTSMKQLAELVKKTIMNVSSVVKTIQETRQLRNLVMFYLISLQGRGLQCRSLKALFTILCDETPTLRVALQRETSSGDTFENRIIQELDTLAEKKNPGLSHSSKSPGRRKSKTPHTKKVDEKFHSHHTPETKPQPAAAHNNILKPRKKPQTQLFSLPRLVRFQNTLTSLSRNLLNKKIAPVVVLVLLFVLKKSGTISQLARKIPALLRRLVTLLNILMSI
ncbi:Pex15p LALA0_S09e07140g [Lachancea lanzarotensis]|uniref:LALA0S09e07140g1_1 n=1 Tax=Lachancea lanzarotensis TaxID=1245769 RepID=A0A0C7NCD2_9SACH|nr:uncharacterized protein LALA0_S09e07140g [Lachancea lanzarotensis]CEP63990.1 LALA0S09e07140g1_1 [Lachancea lanzarotensis]